MSSIKIDEILSYEPPEKRKRAELHQNGSESTAAVNSEDLLKALESADDEAEPLDDVEVKKLILAFEKAVLKNQEMRIKFPDQPQKFMDSEVELNQAIQEMHSIATMPNLYELLTEFKATGSLMQLLAHENADIAVAVVDLLQELTDLDTLEESEEGAKSLIDTLTKGQIVGLLVQNMERLDETNKEEADGVNNSLAVVENIVEFDPEICSATVEQGLLTWLLRRVRQKGTFDGNKLYSSELLGVVLQQSEEVRKALGEKDGIDILLQALATYKRHDPTSADEREFMENLFNCLCASLMHVKNRAKFLEGEGLQLMNLMLRERKDSRASALKVLDYSTTGPEGRDNCNKFVEILGLRTLFPLFMRTPSKNKRRGHTAKEHEEHCSAVIASLLRSCTPSNRLRILTKFTEQDHLKGDRLVELHFRYMERVEKHDKTTKTAEEDEDEKYLNRLDAGLFTLQLVDLIICDICVSGDPTIKERCTKLLNMKGSDFGAVKKVLKEYVENLGVEATEERDRVTELIDRI